MLFIANAVTNTLIGTIDTRTDLRSYADATFDEISQPWNQFNQNIRIYILHTLWNYKTFNQLIYTLQNTTCIYSL